MAIPVPVDQLEAADQAWLALASERIRLTSVSNEGEGSPLPVRDSRARSPRIACPPVLAEWVMLFCLPKTFECRNRVAMVDTCKSANKATGRACEVMIHLWRVRNGKAIQLLALFAAARAMAAAAPDA